jgi:hypothetical protein
MQRARALSARAARLEEKARASKPATGPMGGPALEHVSQVQQRIPLPPTFGWLLKQHSHSMLLAWGRRYVRIDDQRGVVWYAKSATARPSAVMPLGDVQVITPHTIDDLSFVVSCPPIRLTLRASDQAELAVWVSSLRECASAWKRRTDDEAHLRRL